MLPSHDCQYPFAIKMSCCNFWTPHEDICIVFYASRGVLPEASSEILHLICGSERHVPCVKKRVCHIVKTDHLYCFYTHRFLYKRVQLWIESRANPNFLFRLRFTNSILRVVLKVFLSCFDVRAAADGIPSSRPLSP